MAIEKQFADFLFGEINDMMQDIPPETATRLKKHLDQLQNVVDASLQNNTGTSTRGRRSGNS